MSNQNHPQDPFLHSKSLWQATIEMVKQTPEFKLKSEVLLEASRAGEIYLKADDNFADVAKAAEQLYAANCAIRKMFGAYLRTLFGALNDQLKNFFLMEHPSPVIKAKCQAALQAFDDALFHDTRCEKGIKTFTLRLSTYYGCVKTLADARAEHARNMETLRKLHQKQAAGALIGTRERTKLGQVAHLPEVRAEKAKAEAEARRLSELTALRKQRAAAVADLIPA